MTWVIINGQHLMPGHKDAWRRGEILPQEHQSLVAVMCPARGKEKKSRKIMCSPSDLLRDIESVRKTIKEHFGIEYLDQLEDHKRTEIKS